ncbi:MAG TPA: HD domain-containing phosphohydrolase [Candidatus Brocadiaceae bacterium]|nr:HD domain-containing phosphohydrolase [Candidatus Brocadiaceae bacterium]
MEFSCQNCSGYYVTYPKNKIHNSLYPFRKLLQAVEQSPATVVVTDTNGRLEYANPKFSQIPFLARIFAVVDVWDALRFDRPYRKGMPEAQALKYIISNAATHFDPQVVETFLKLERRYVFCGTKHSEAGAVS